MASGDRRFLDSANPKTCVVLGGRGFLGRSLVTKLLELGNWIVRVADSALSLNLDPSSDSDLLLTDAISSGLASYHSVDVTDKSQIVRAVEGSSIVFYMDGSELDITDFYHCYMTIIQGTKNIITACRECRVRKLIYNSSADVVFDGSCDIHNGKESFAYSWKHEEMLIDLKAQAEAVILFANDNDGLLTCALRPSNVFGPEDRRLVPFLINYAKSGWAKFMIGSGQNMSDFTYYENVIHAHLCAEQALDSKMVAAAGKAFFITNLEPVKFWDFVSLLFEGLGYQRTFDCAAAKDHIRYSPLVSLEEGVKRTIKSLSHLAQESSVARYGFRGQSKAEKMLGGGKVAYILLWRDEKTSFSYFVALSLLLYWYLLCGRTFASSTAILLLLVVVFLYIYGNLPVTICKISLPKISLHSEVSVIAVTESVSTLACIWNKGCCSLKSLGHGSNWNTFLKVTIFLYLLKSMSHCFTLAMSVVLVFAFTAFFIYEQYEPLFDGVAEVVPNILRESKQLLLGN